MSDASRRLSVAGIFRALLNATGTLSFLLLLCVIVLWTWLGRQRHGIAYATGQTQLAVMAVHDAMALKYSSVPWPLYSGFEHQVGNLFIARDPMDGADAGKEIDTVDRWMHVLADVGAWGDVTRYSSRSGGALHRLVDVNVRLPYWLLVLMTAALPTWIATVHRWKRRRERRRLLGECEQCGYDLRATPHRCPECGCSQELADTCKVGTSA